MKRIPTLLGFVFLLISQYPLSAQKYSNEFLAIGIGAHAGGMGGAVTATTSDIMSSYWNPAGLAKMAGEDGLQIGAMHSEWFAGVSKHDFLGFSLPSSKNNQRLAFSIIRFGIDGIPNTLSLYNSDGTINFDNVTEFSASDYAFVGTYSKKIKTSKGKLLAGGNLKVVHRRIGPFATSWGFGVDLGVQYHINKWNFGLMARDITTTFNGWSINFTEDELAVLQAEGNDVNIQSLEITKPSITLGAAYQARISENTQLRPAIDVIITTDGQRNTLVSSSPFSMDIAAGMELIYKDFISLRGGVNQFQYYEEFDGSETLVVRPSMGIGLQLGKLQLDYAYLNPSDGQNRYSHLVSLIFDIKPKK